MFSDVEIVMQSDTLELRFMLKHTPWGYLSMN